MKYSFKIPFAESDELYVISHSIFLSEQEARDLQTLEGCVTKVGSFVAVRSAKEETNEPGKEVFCLYKIIAAKHAKHVIPTEVGWWIYLGTASQVKKILPIKEGGCNFLATSYHDIYEINSVAYPVIHQIVISADSDLDRNMYCCHFPQTSCR